MFSKTTSGQQPQQSQATPRPSVSSSASYAAQTDARRAKPASLLASDLVFEGNISGDGELMIDGVLKGDVHVARLIVGEHARVEGTVRGAQVEVRGQVHGNIEGKSVRLLETAHVEGDILHEQLAIDVGAFFQGRCAQFKAPAGKPAPLPQLEPTPAPAELIALEQAAE